MIESRCALNIPKFPTISLLLDLGSEWPLVFLSPMEFECSFAGVFVQGDGGHTDRQRPVYFASILRAWSLSIAATATSCTTCASVDPMRRFLEKSRKSAWYVSFDELPGRSFRISVTPFSARNGNISLKASLLRTIKLYSSP